MESLRALARGEKLCQVISPAGNFMFWSSPARAEWYIRKNLAERKDNDRIQLTFVPKGEGYHQDAYHFQISHLNCGFCCVCGGKEDLSLHHIFPNCYRSWTWKYFPHVYRHYVVDMHDIVLMCHKCHWGYEQCASRFKKKLNLRYGVSFCCTQYTEQEKQLQQIKKVAGALLKHSSVMPTEKIGNYRKQCYNYLQTDFDDADLLKLSKLVIRPVSIGMSHGEAVIAKLDQQSLCELVIEWRIHFLQHTKARMPPMWNLTRDLCASPPIDDHST